MGFGGVADAIAKLVLQRLHPYSIKPTVGLHSNIFQTGIYISAQADLIDSLIKHK